MIGSIRLTSTIVAASAACVTLAGPARADDRAICVESYENAQKLRAQNKLRAAREELLVCTRDTCPKLVKPDCARWMEEVTASLPSLVFAARDAGGVDRADARVWIDGERVTEQLGQEVVVDPGVHTIRFEADRSAPIEQQIVVRAGEKARNVSVTLADEVAPAHGPDPPTKEPESPVPSRRDDEARPLPVLVPILGGLGVAALGTAAYLTVSTSSQLDELRTRCAPHCEQSDVDTLNLRYRVAAVAGGVGLVAVGAAVWLYVNRPSTRDKTRTALRVSPSGIWVVGGF